MSMKDRISERRKLKHMTQMQLAEAVGVSYPAVSGWERGDYIPGSENIHALAAVLGVSVAWLKEEKGFYELGSDASERLFSEEHMYTQVKSAANARGLMQTIRALPYAKEQHKNQFRKGRDEVPYINHPLMMACHALALGIGEDNVLAAILLHDVCEDCSVQPEQLPVSDEVQSAVRLLTFSCLPGEDENKARENYYAAIQGSRIASIVKVIDRCNNISTMAVGFDRKGMASYITETETYVMPLLNYIKQTYPEYYDAAFLLKYHMKSLLESLKRLV